MHVIHLMASLYHYFLSNQNIKHMTLQQHYFVHYRNPQVLFFCNWCFVWFTDNENSEKIFFFRKLKSHPAYSTCYSFGHILLSTIIYAINNIDNSVFLSKQTKSIIMKISCTSSTIHKIDCEYRSSLNMIWKNIKMPLGRCGWWSWNFL